jgi:hypothetical protein
MLLCFGDAACKHGLIGTEPVSKGSGGESKMKFDIIKEVILVSGEKEFAFIINSMDFGFCFKSLYWLMAGLIVTMDDSIADSPEEVPFFPDAAQNVCCP